MVQGLTGVPGNSQESGPRPGLTHPCRTLLGPPSPSGQKRPGGLSALVREEMDWFVSKAAASVLTSVPTDRGQSARPSSERAPSSFRPPFAEPVDVRHQLRAALPRVVFFSPEHSAATP